MATNKQRGLADARPRSPMVTTVIEDFEYNNKGNQTESDNEDDLEYPGDVPESLVRPFF